MTNLPAVPSNHDMWRAYAIAPAVTPLTFIAIVSIFGGTLQVSQIAIAFLACYLVAGLIGMPIAFALRRSHSLNAWTIHVAALAWGILWSLFCTSVLIYVAVAIGASVESLPLTAAFVAAIMVPPVVLAGTAFWLLINNKKLV